MPRPGESGRAQPRPYEQEWIDRGSDHLGLRWYPATSAAAPMVVLWPAMGVPAGYYRPFLTGLLRAGLAVAAVDLRGTGDSTPRASRASRYGYAELTDDVGAVLEHLKPRRDGRRVVLLGHSLGGQVCLLHAARTGGADVDGLALVAVGLPYWRRYQGLRRLLVWPFTQAIGATSALLGYWPGWGFGGRQARGVVRDWAYTARTGRLPAVPGVDPAEAVAALSLPVLAVSLARDTHTPASTVDYLVTGLTGARVRRTHLDGDADHFTWARSESGPVVAAVTAFAAGLAD